MAWQSCGFVTAFSIDIDRWHFIQVEKRYVWQTNGQWARLERLLSAEGMTEVLCVL